MHHTLTYRDDGAVYVSQCNDEWVEGDDVSPQDRLAGIKPTCPKCYASVHP